MKQLLKGDERPEMKEGQMVGLKLLQSLAKMRPESWSRQGRSGAEPELLKKEQVPFPLGSVRFQAARRRPEAFLLRSSGL